jgi:hypothetical protein
MVNLLVMGVKRNQGEYLVSVLYAARLGRPRPASMKFADFPCCRLVFIIKFSCSPVRVGDHRCTPWWLVIVNFLMGQCLRGGLVWPVFCFGQTGDLVVVSGSTFCLILDRLYTWYRVYTYVSAPSYRYTSGLRTCNLMFTNKVRRVVTLGMVAQF